VATNIECGKNPRGVPLVPLQRSAGDEAAQIVEHEIAAEGELAIDNLEAVRRAGEGREVVAGEILEAGRRQVAAVRGVDASVDSALNALTRVGLEEFADIVVRQLSQGQKRRVALARLCGATPARLWILDEPFNALDARTVESLYLLIEAQLASGGIVVLTAHQKVDLPAAARRLDLLGRAFA